MARARKKVRGPSRAAALFAALGDETRLRIVELLVASGFSTATRLARSVHVSRQAVTKHLEVLERAGLVSSRGSRRLWGMRVAPLEEVRVYLSSLSDVWATTLRRREELLALLDSISPGHRARGRNIDE